MSELEIKFEKVVNIWPDLERLAIQEQIEVGEERRFGPDWQSMAILNEQGILQVLTAWVDYRMVGYLGWLLDFDLESKGTLIANQISWFVEPKHPVVAVKMLDRAIAEMKKASVEFVYFHHVINGRGATVGRLFERRGAKLLSHNYVMRLKGA